MCIRDSLYGEALGFLVDGHALIQQFRAQRVHDAAVAQAVEVQRRGGDDRAPQAAQHVEEKGHVLANSAYGDRKSVSGASGALTSSSP